MSFLNRPEGRIHWRAQGEGPLAILIHGLLLGDAASWPSALTAELARTHRVLSYDLPGHGLSALPDTQRFGPVRLAEDLDQLVKALALDPPLSLVGHSYGGLIALEFARLFPEQLSTLTLIETPRPPLAPPQSSGERAALLNQAERDPLPIAAALLPGGLDGPFLGNGRRRERRLQRWGRLFRESPLLEELAQVPPWDIATLQQLRLPIQLIYGKNSACFEAGNDLAGQLGNARFHTLNGDHFLP
ncbi:MAG: alpha/beta hydrolase, partial [Myxococcota bacterium]|nr:alpha/beta hydrolase [Myxococcota bacterium]